MGEHLYGVTWKDGRGIQVVANNERAARFIAASARKAFRYPKSKIDQVVRVRKCFR